MTQTAALAWTLAIEVPVVALVAAWRRPAPRGLRFAVPVAVGASLLTHPLLWMTQDLGLLRGWTAIVCAEVVVALVEGAALAWAAGLGARRGFAASVLANAASFGAGLLLTA